jgi:hypothetical protein
VDSGIPHSVEFEDVGRFGYDWKLESRLQAPRSEPEACPKMRVAVHRWPAARRA